MVEFGNIRSFYLIVAVVGTCALILYGRAMTNRSLGRFADSRLVTMLLQNHSKGRRTIKQALIVIGLFMLVMSMAMPRLGRGLRTIKREGADIAIALDVSLSMLAEDVKPSRMDVAKDVIRTIVSVLPDDRFALIGFAGDSFVHCPLTTDRGAVLMFLDFLKPGMAVDEGTDIGRAISVSVQALSKSTGTCKAILLITDGEDHGGTVEESLSVASLHGIKIFVVGIGTQVGEPIPIRDQSGNVASYKRDKQGNVVVSRLDIGLLKSIAARTGGESFFLESSGRGVNSLARSLSKVERSTIEERKFKDYVELFQIPLVFCLLLLVVEGLMSDGSKKSAA